MSGLNSLLHTIGDNLPFRTEQELRDFHAGVDELGNSDDVADDQDVTDDDGPVDGAKPADPNAAKPPVVGAKPATVKK